MSKQLDRLNGVKYCVDAALQDISKVCELGGIPEVYKSTWEWLCDFWPDLPWDSQSLAMAIPMVLERKDLLDRFQQATGFDLENELQAGLVAAHDIGK